MNELTKRLMAIPTRPDPETGDPLVSREVVLGLVGGNELSIEQIRHAVNWCCDGQIPERCNFYTLTEALNYCLRTGGLYTPNGLRAAAERQMKRGSK